MAAYGGLHHIFDKPLKIDPLPSWKPINPIDDSSQIHFEHNIESVPSELDKTPKNKHHHDSSQMHFDHNTDSASFEFNRTLKNGYFPIEQAKLHRHNMSFSSMSSESLSMCTEGLGFESFDDVEELKNEREGSDEWKVRQGFDDKTKYGVSKRSRITGVEFPPPISSIGRSGKPCVCLKAYRDNGRFILKEVRIPTQEFLHACREDGRLKLRFIQSDDDLIDEYEDKDDQDKDEDE